ncbi:Acetyltransferase [Lachnellula occidentalis]|uniref:Acetyltransferase n=1 Tax=Lachnellula occidentalis TaxID=215460 RepID=A0A8H8S7Z9_9HELO|nr:Acetyltransferase [Lachnellula occidentalis]
MTSRILGVVVLRLQYYKFIYFQILGNRRPNMAAKPPFTIRHATSPTDISSIRTLFTSYVSWLDIDLTFQNFTQELASLPGLYAAPTGCLLLAVLESGEAVGCVALRPLPSKSAPISASEEVRDAVKERRICEVKRLFLTPESRGLGIGRALVKAVIAEAQKLGYEEMKLDTLPRMVGARRLYESMGFVETERYYETPLEGTVFYRKELG